MSAVLTLVNDNGHARFRLASFEGLVAAFGLLTILLSGCATQPTETPPWTFPQLPSPRVTRLPLTVGVHYPEAFLHEKYEEKDENDGWTIWYMHGPGSAGAALFDSALAASFAKVVHIPAWPPATGAEPDVALVIVPRLTELSTVHGYITYEIGFYTPEGKRTSTWTVHATGDVSFFGGHEIFTASVLRGAAAKLLIGFQERKEVAALLPGHAMATNAGRREGVSVQGTTIAVLPKSTDDEEWLDCIRNGIRDGASSVKFVELEPFRDALFPWFEPSADEPATPAAWAKRLSDPAIARGAQKMGARYVLLVGGETTNGTLNGSFMCTGGTGGLGCFGLSTGTRRTGLQLTLADFVRRELVGKVEVAENGEYTWMGLIVPIGWASTTEADACEKASRKIVEMLDGR